uniref:WAP domain-containing protein n=1 Tax=Anopheles minimus TaxID=112268 RepID=A0A182W7Y4_9DIPT
MQLASKNNMYKRMILLTIVILFCLKACEAQGANKQCAQNNEYCLTHRDCCSGSCLSFSYKCVPVPAGASIGTISVPVNPTPIDTENRFGGDDGGASLTQKTCALNGEYCLTHAECCSGSCLTFSYKCVPLNPPGTTPIESKDSTTQKPSVSFTNRIGEESSSNPTTSSLSTPKKCAGIGEYCLTASECCSKSCLSFAYKCVNRYDLYAGADNNPTTTTISTANRFGDSAVDTNPGTRQCTSNGLYCFHNKECCSGACYKSICSTEIRLGVPESELTRPSVANGPYIPMISFLDLGDKFQQLNKALSVKKGVAKSSVISAVGMKIAALQIAIRIDESASTNISL